MSWFDSIFTGQNDTLNKNINQFGQDAGVAQKQGQGDTNAASSFYQNILSGDPTLEAKAIAPETAAAQQGAQQQKNALAQFGNRSGGTAAAASGIDAQTRSQLTQLLGGLKTGAASGAAGLGTAEQGLSLQDKAQQDQASQQRLQNWMNSILGQGVQGAANYGESFLPIAHGG